MNVVVAVQFVQLPNDIYRDVITAIETLTDAVSHLSLATEDRKSFKRKEREAILVYCKEAVAYAQAAMDNGQYRKFQLAFSVSSSSA
jgi:hypothetical protein